MFTVTLSAKSSQTINVDYVTQDGTATAGSDYSTAAGQISFAPGTVTRTITVVVTGDTTNEENETFTVVLSLPGAQNATIADGTGLGTITNDDSPLPSISINTPSSRTEGQNITFNVTLAPSSATAVTVDWKIVDVTTLPADYSGPTSGTVTFNPGQTSRSIVIPTVDDVLNELTETFEVHLSNPSANATIFNGIGTGTINDDNDAQPGLAITSESIAEGNAGNATMTFTVTLSSVSGRTVTVDYGTQDVTASSSGGGRDYTAASGSLTFLPGETVKTVTVTTRGDTAVEGNETFKVILSNALGATLATGEGTGTIVDDD